MRIKHLVIAAASVMFLSLTGAPALALGTSNSHADTVESQSSNETTDNSGDSSTGTGNQSDSKLSNAQQKSCENRQKAVNNIINHIITRGQNQLTLFNTIAQRVETFATNKNLTVPNYSQLLATLQADQTKATNDLAAMKTNAILDCTSPNPKATVDAFKADLKQEISDLKTYKTDVKNLIVAVKTSIGTSNTSNTSSTSSTGGTQ